MQKNSAAKIRLQQRVIATKRDYDLLKRRIISQQKRNTTARVGIAGKLLLLGLSVTTNMFLSGSEPRCRQAAGQAWDAATALRDGEASRGGVDRGGGAGLPRCHL